MSSRIPRLRDEGSAKNHVGHTNGPKRDPTPTVRSLSVFALRDDTVGRDYFFINSSTALVMPMIPTRIVGSGTGANLLECKLGNSFPSFLNCAIFSGSTAPMWKSTAGIEWSGKLY